MVGLMKSDARHEDTSTLQKEVQLHRLHTAFTSQGYGICEEGDYMTGSQTNPHEYLTAFFQALLSFSGYGLCQLLPATIIYQGE